MPTFTLSRSPPPSIGDSENPSASPSDPDFANALRKFRPTVFFHCAWQGVAGSARDDPSQMASNLPLTFDTIKWAADSGCDHWIGLGSQAEYGPANRKLSETSPTSPTTLYGAAKLAACVASEYRCRELALSWSWVRVFSIYGPGDKPHWLIPYLIGEFRGGRSPRLTMCEQRWDYLFIDDAVGALLAIARSRSTGIFNLGSGDAAPLRDVVELIRRRIPGAPPAAFGEVPYRPDQVMHLQADISQLQSATDWAPQVSLQEGIARTVDLATAGTPRRPSAGP